MNANSEVLRSQAVQHWHDRRCPDLPVQHWHRFRRVRTTQTRNSALLQNDAGCSAPRFDLSDEDAAAKPGCAALAWSSVAVQRCLRATPIRLSSSPSSHKPSTCSPRCLKALTMSSKKRATNLQLNSHVVEANCQLRRVVRQLSESGPRRCLLHLLPSFHEARDARRRGLRSSVCWRYRLYSTAHRVLDASQEVCAERTPSRLMS